LKKNIEEFEKITDKSLLLQDQKKAIAGFKIREDMELGLSVTLRGEKCMPFNKITIFMLKFVIFAVLS
jgi:ribosomal protein L5